MPIDGNIKEAIEILEDIFNPYDFLFSMLIPIVWDISNAPGFKELMEWFASEMDDIREEPWHKESPIRAAARMIHSLKHTTEPIEIK